jgi:hypothetical protein
MEKLKDFLEHRGTVLVAELSRTATHRRSKTVRLGRPR